MQMNYAEIYYFHMVIIWEMNTELISAILHECIIFKTLSNNHGK